MVTVKQVIDGDTIITRDGIHVRLIGIDTPEMHYGGGEAEAGAVAARRFLEGLLPRGSRVGMEFDEERQDQYGRELAHLFSTDGRNIEVRLLEEGLATPFIFPPNLKYAACYQGVAERARARRAGLWQLPRYMPTAVETLVKSDRGYHIVYGKVRSVRDSKHSLIIDMEGPISVTINHANLKYFPKTDINGLKGNQIEVHGELYQRDDQLWITIRHPLDLKIRSSVYNPSE